MNADIILCITLGFIALDFLSGFIQAVSNKVLSSQKMKSGLFHKCAFMLAIALGYLIEFSIGYIDLGFTLPISNAVCAYVCLTEIISITENMVKLNPELEGTKLIGLFKGEDRE